jgi:hypothetical protein
MDHIAPPLACAIEMQHALRNGETPRAGVARFLEASDGEFARQLRRALLAWDQGGDWRPEAARMRSPYRRAICDALMRSLSGQPIQARLDELRTEIELACELEIRRHVDLLPLKAMVPLLLLQFPAFLILLLGPLLSRLLEELSR